MARYKRLQKQQDKGMKTVARPFRYNNSIDIWALGKILEELVCDVPLSIIRGKIITAPKQPAIRLINKMQEAPKKRPTASECLKDPWMISDDSFGSPLATKRDRSPTPAISSVQPSKRVLQK
ncbi:hypothetical protein MMC14_010088, partial [Varicellaria rhodocarpa]|nr:hypothetical protein [Varicellaria rhodocarpa]